jgi:serine phosphatase RsbU (regulator of sigma subunit)
MMNTEERKLVLVVDDAPANIQVVQSILKDDYKIRIATNGAKALELVNVVPTPDLVLLDVMMPEMDGYEVCRRLKESPATRDIPVIFLTGKTEAEDEARGFEMGAVDYIHKPFSPAIVKARVKTHLTLRDAREQLAQQLKNIRHELDMAREIQLSILPRQVPRVEGLEIAARFLPMTTVAGDFYDFLVVDEQRVGVFVADVSGHGPAAALIASMLRIALSTQIEDAAEPDKVLSGLNQALCGRLGNFFVTAAYVFVDVQKGVLRYAGAGHPPLLQWQKAPACAREVEENGLFLGQFPEETYVAVEMPLEAGDRSVLYTDGVPECRNPLKEEFGTKRFLRYIEENPSLGTNQFTDALIDRLSEWSEHPRGEGQRDDITVLTIDYRGN